jgi:hypothetical protein
MADDETEVLKELLQKIEIASASLRPLTERLADRFVAAVNESNLTLAKTGSSVGKLLELERLREEVRRAEDDARWEEEAAAEDQELLRRTEDLSAQVERCRSLIKLTQQAEQDRRKAEEDSVRLQFILEARQVKLLGELQTVYPIDRISSEGSGGGKERFAIRGVELTSPFEGSPRDDEQISTVLGYIAHVVLLLSKYLEIPLRWQVLFFASRSIIRDPAQKDPKDQNLPLYRTDVEPERFRRAVLLLTKDVEQLMQRRDIPFESNKGILHNLYKLFRREMDPMGVVRE